MALVQNSAAIFNREDSKIAHFSQNTSHVVRKVDKATAQNDYNYLIKVKLRASELGTHYPRICPNRKHRHRELMSTPNPIRLPSDNPV